MTRIFSNTNRAPAAIAGDATLRERDERLESLKAVIGKLAHDFNNFLVPLLGYVTLIREEVPEASSAGQYAMTMEAAARKTEGFLDSVLLSVRPQRRFNPKELDFGALVQAAIDRFKAGVPEGAQIKLDASIVSAETYVDEAQWHTVLSHLLKNAHFAVATGGTMSVTLTREQ